MTTLLLALRSDAYLLLRARGLRVGAVLVALVAAGRIVLGRLHEAGQEARGVVFGAAVDAAPPSAWALLVDGLRAGWTLAFFLLLAAAASGLASEREHGHSRVLVVGGVSRLSMVGARFLSQTIVGIILAIAACIGASGGAAAFADFGPVTEEGLEIWSASDVRSELLIAVAGSLITLPAIVAFGLLVGSCARSATQSVAVALGLSIVWDMAKSSLGRAAAWGYASYQPTLVDTSYLREVGQMARGFSDFRDVEALNFIVPLPEAALFLVLTLAVTVRRKL